MIRIILIWLFCQINMWMFYQQWAPHTALSYLYFSIWKERINMYNSGGMALSEPHTNADEFSLIGFQ